MGTHTAVMPWTITERSRNIHHVALDLPKVNDERWFLLQSDVHWDNPHCDRKLLKKHLEQAKERDAGILDNGDWFCAMQGKFDKRSNKSEIRPEHQRGDYLDALVETAAEYLDPYKHLLLVRGSGNHESSILKNHETNLTERLVDRLKVRGSTTIHQGGYSGFVVFAVTHNRTRYAGFKLHYHHGHGGGGPVTRGVIQTNRMAVMLADADVSWQGHTHDAYQLPIARIKLNQDNTKIVHTRQVHLRTPGYKEEYVDGYGGWHVERGAPPKPVGAAWLRFYRSDHYTVDFDITEAR